jgi:hypothetical protein
VRAMRRATIPALALAAWVTTITPAAAQLTGPCEGRLSAADADGGATQEIDFVTSTELEVPQQGFLRYEATFDDSSGERRAYEARIELRTPPPLPSLTLHEGDGTTEGRLAAERAYTAPSWLPRGTSFPITVDASVGGERCVALASVTVAGSPWGPVTVVTLVLTALAWAGVLVLGRNLIEGFGSPVLFTLAGLVAGALSSLSLVLLGIIALDSLVVTLLPVITAVVAAGIALFSEYARGGTDPYRAGADEHP